MGMLLIIKDWGNVFSGYKITIMELSASKILEENLVQSAFPQTLGEEFTFQHKNNLKKTRPNLHWSCLPRRQ
jgi:hypothetical protein